MGNEKDGILSPNHKNSEKLIGVLYLLGSLAVLAMAIISAYQGESSEPTANLKSEDIANQGHLPRKILKKPPGIEVSSMVASTIIPPRGQLSRSHFEIRIAPSDFQKIALKREEALAQDVLLSSDADFVPAEISINGESHKVKLRLKGDKKDHWATKKWSFRVHVSGNDSIFGVRKFSVQQPGTRNVIGEWLFHRAMNFEDIISLRYEFIDVTLNGKYMGVYAFEEHFDRILIEHNQRREGPILKFDESLFWKTFQYPIWKETYFYSSSIQGFNQNRILRNPKLKEAFTRGISKLESFRTQEAKVKEVFDFDRLAKYYALAELFGSTHISLRFYLNPITSLLEPIAFDANAGVKLTNLISIRRRLRESVVFDFDYFVFSDLEFVARYHSELERISDKNYVDNFLAHVNDDFQTSLDFIKRDYPRYTFAGEILYENQQLIRHALFPVKGLHGYVERLTSNQLTLNLGVIQPMPVEVIALVRNQTVITKLEPPIRIKGKVATEAVDYKRLSFEIPNLEEIDENILEEISLRYRIIGTSGWQEIALFPWPHKDLDTVIEETISEVSEFESLDFIKVKKDENLIIFKKGTWNIEKTLSLPQNYRLIIGPGTSLKLKNNASIISYSPVELMGTKNSNIQITAAPNSASGFAVLSPEEKSIITCVQFANLTAPSIKGSELTGSVTLYEASARIWNCQFKNSKSEDSLNIVRGEVNLDDCVFQNSYGDGIDADFISESVIKNCKFFNTGNDGIDVSGSTVQVLNSNLEACGDKGISVGENCQVRIANCVVNESKIGIAGKDMSIVSIENCKFDNCSIGLAAYQKKPEFGGANIYANGLTVLNSDTPYIVEKGSRLVIDNKLIPAVRQRLVRLLYGVEIEDRAH